MKKIVNVKRIVKYLTILFLCTMIIMVVKMEEENIISEIKQMHHAIGRRLFEMHNQEKSKIHPSPLQTEIICFLLKKEGKDVILKDLQEELKISKAAISDAIDKMVKKGFIEKQVFEKDARKTKLILLKEGKEVFSKLEGNMKKMNEEIQKGLSEKDLEDFFRISHKIEMNLEKEGKK